MYDYARFPLFCLQRCWGLSRKRRRYWTGTSIICSFGAINLIDDSFLCQFGPPYLATIIHRDDVFVWLWFVIFLVHWNLWTWSIIFGFALFRKKKLVTENISSSITNLSGWVLLMWLLESPCSLSGVGPVPYWFVRLEPSARLARMSSMQNHALSHDSVSIIKS